MTQCDRHAQVAIEAASACVAGESALHGSGTRWRGCVFARVCVSVAASVQVGARCATH